MTILVTSYCTVLVLVTIVQLWSKPPRGPCFMGFYDTNTCIWTGLYENSESTIAGCDCSKLSRTILMLVLFFFFQVLNGCTVFKSWLSTSCCGWGIHIDRIQLCKLHALFVWHWHVCVNVRNKPIVSVPTSGTLWSVLNFPIQPVGRQITNKVS